MKEARFVPGLTDVLLNPRSLAHSVIEGVNPDLLVSSHNPVPPLRSSEPVQRNERAAPRGERLLRYFIVLSVGRRLQPSQQDAADLFLPYSNPISPLPSSSIVAGSAAACGSE